MARRGNCLNAVMVIKEVRNKIEKEQSDLADIIKLNESSVGFDKEKVLREHNIKLVDFIKRSLGLVLIEPFAKNHNNDENELASFFDSACKLDALQYLDFIAENLNIQEDFFERLMAKTLLSEKKDDSNICFNNFTISSLSKVDSKVFYTKVENLISFAKIINNICCDDLDYPQMRDFFCLANLNAFDEDFSEIEFGKIKFTALQNGKVKITLTKEMEEKIEEKVNPFLSTLQMKIINRI